MASASTTPWPLAQHWQRDHRRRRSGGSPHVVGCYPPRADECARTAVAATASECWLLVWIGLKLA
ncbi:hypothetical protein E2562_003039 [Oryza meyeriana var. granulata]|uniref:Uncharacterized protein n=1 Tax=Oryza meyeriana var. granulata TaxID=110450 RepID=A0A6G1DDN4_9ORYZ|nr:hypothetical protein E2562_003039 [Oryza meyeriana var. granulata]